MEPKGKTSVSGSSESGSLEMMGNGTQNNETLSVPLHRRIVVGNQNSSSQAAANRTQNGEQGTETPSASGTSDDIVIMGEQLEPQQSRVASAGSPWKHVLHTHGTLENAASCASALKTSIPAAAGVNETSISCVDSNVESKLQKGDNSEIACPQQLQESENKKGRTYSRREIPDIDEEFGRLLLDSSDSDEEIKREMRKNLPPMTLAEMLLTMQDACTTEELDVEVKQLFPETLAKQLLPAMQSHDVDAMTNLLLPRVASQYLTNEVRIPTHESLKEEQKAEVHLEVDAAAGEHLVSSGLALEDELKIAMEESLTKEQPTALPSEVDVNLVSSVLSPEDMQDELRNAMQENITEEQRADLQFEVDVAGGGNLVSSVISPEDKQEILTKEQQSELVFQANMAAAELLIAKFTSARHKTVLYEAAPENLPATSLSPEDVKDEIKNAMQEKPLK